MLPAPFFSMTLLNYVVLHPVLVPGEPFGKPKRILQWPNLRPLRRFGQNDTGEVREGKKKNECEIPGKQSLF